MTGQHNNRSVSRALFPGLIVVLVSAYTAGVLTGRIGTANRLDVTHLALIGLAGVVILLAIQPEAFSRLRRFKAGSIEFEMLEQVRETRNELRDLRLILPLLLPPVEQTHLLNLAAGKTKQYRGSSELRSELRRLRYMGLIAMRGTGFIADMRDDLVFDLAHYVALTELGNRVAARITEVADAD